MLSLDRTILVMMDEALCIYKMRGGRVSFVEAIDWDHQAFSSRLVGLIHTTCGGRPVVILNDMVEQYYRKERVFTSGVGRLDKQSMVNRKLGMVFPSYSVRTSFPLKERLKREGSKISSEVYLFSAIATTDKLTKTVGAINASSALPLGLGLLPLESVGFVEALLKKLLPKDVKKKAKKGAEVPAQWTLFIGQHRNGYLRQIVVRDGDIALTRMTQVTDPEDTSADLWARDVVKEYRSTMNYLSRLGHQAHEELNVVVVAPSDYTESLRTAIEERHHIYTLTCLEAAQALRLKVEARADGFYSDILHAAWAARKVKLSVGLPVRSLAPVMRARFTACFLSAGLAGLLLFSCVMFGQSFLRFSGKKAELSDTRARLVQVRSSYQAEVDRMFGLGVDLPLIQVTSRAHKALQAGDVAFLPFLRVIADSLADDDVLLKKIDFSVDPKLSDMTKLSVQGQVRLHGRFVKQAVPDHPMTPPVSITLLIVFDPEANRDVSSQALQQLALRLRGKLPSHTVEITKFLGDKRYVQGVVGDDGQPLSDQSSLAELVITGGGDA